MTPNVNVSLAVRMSFVHVAPELGLFANLRQQFGTTLNPSTPNALLVRFRAPTLSYFQRGFYGPG